MPVSKTPGNTEYFSTHYIYQVTEKMKQHRPLRAVLLCSLLCLGMQASAQASNGLVIQTLAVAQNTTKAKLPLHKAFQDLQARFNVSFLFKDSDLMGKELPAELIEGKELNAILMSVAKETNIRIEQSAGSVFTISAEAAAPVAPTTTEAAAQAVKKAGVKELIKVKGTVKDELGEPLPSATVTVKSTNKTVGTDLDGNFSVEAEDTDVLIIRFLGYTTQEVPVAGRTSITISLQPSSLQKDEVVVVGYGTKTRKEVSSSISSVGAKEITATPVADAAQALQGRVAGVQIIQNSGAPGGTGGTSIRIRGISSVNGSNNPLIVLDGFPLPDQTSDNILNSINPNDIESIDVLKDAAAASIYGVRGSNGVIMITTKRGKEGKMTVSLDAYRGLQSAWNLPSMLDAREYAIINSEARIASGINPLPKLANPDLIAAEYGSGTNWLDEIFRNAAMTNYALNIAGGTDKVKYAVSGGYFQQDGIVRGTNFDRYSLRFNGDMQVSKKFKIGNSITMSRTQEVPRNTYDPFNSLLLLAVASPPTVRPFNPDGTYAGGNGQVDGFNEPNPVYDINVPQTTNTKFRAITSVFAEYEIIEGLSARVNLGLDFVMQNIRTWSPAIPSTGGRPIPITGFADNTSFNPSYLGEVTLNYKKSWGDHNFNALIGYTAQDNNFNYLGASRNGYTRLDMRVLDDAAVVPQNLSQIGNFGGYGTNRLVSYIGRLGYDYKGKYIFSFSLRQDGSSNFGPGNKYALFPSASAAWNVSDEAFMADFTTISNLKVRASIGQTGNQNVAAFAYIQRVNTGIQYPFGNSSGSGGANPAAAPTATKNADLRWERNQQANLGIDLGLWRNKVSLSMDIYDRRSQDLIFNVIPTATSGTYESTPINTGTMVNQGIDLSLTTINLPDASPVNWASTVIFSTFQNRVSSLGLSAPIFSTFSRISGGGLRVDEGAPVNYFYGYEAIGIFQTREEIANSAVQTPGNNPAASTSPGDIKFRDVNNDGVINDQDRVNLGNSIPNFTFGFNNTVTYKGFELNVFLQGSFGNKVLNFTRWYTEGGVANGNFSKAVLNRWTGPGTSNDMPRMIQSDPNQNNRVSSRFVEDASYLRVKNVRLAYTIPAQWSKSISVSSIKVYASVQNALTFTRYTGFDPEVGGGVDFGFYPQARTWLGGLTFDF